jgi:hypothetical protein
LLCATTTAVIFFALRRRSPAADVLVDDPAADVAAAAADVAACSICYDDLLDDPAATYTTRCGHRFCMECSVRIPEMRIARAHRCSGCPPGATDVVPCPMCRAHLHDVPRAAVARNAVTSLAALRDLYEHVVNTSTVRAAGVRAYDDILSSIREGPLGAVLTVEDAQTAMRGVARHREYALRDEAQREAAAVAILARVPVAPPPVLLPVPVAPLPAPTSHQCEAMRTSGAPGRCMHRISSTTLPPNVHFCGIHRNMVARGRTVHRITADAQ